MQNPSCMQKTLDSFFFVVEIKMGTERQQLVCRSELSSKAAAIAQQPERSSTHIDLELDEVTRSGAQVRTQHSSQPGEAGFDPCRRSRLCRRTSWAHSSPVWIQRSSWAAGAPRTTAEDEIDPEKNRSTEKKKLVNRKDELRRPET